MTSTNSTAVSKKFAADTLQALAPFIDLFDCGVKVVAFNGDKSCPHLITDEVRQLFTRYKNGEHKLTYDGGFPFHPWHYTTDILNAKHIKQMVEGSRTYYYTGGTSGKTISMVDIDAHNGEDDADACADYVLSLLGHNNVFKVGSTGGVNLHLKFHYFNVNQYRDLFSELCKILKFLCADKFNSNIDTAKGLPGIRNGRYTYEKHGVEAKLPCYGAWDYKKLHEFESLPILTIQWLKDTLDRLKSLLPTKTEAPKPTIKLVDPLQHIGSVSGCGIKQEHLTPKYMERFSAKVKSEVWHLLDRSHQPIKQRKKLVQEDYVIGLFLLAHLKENDDGSMPNDRIEWHWRYLNENGITTRGWDASRWKAIRNTLSDYQFIRFEDERYWFIPGEHIGQAMKYELKNKEEFIVMENKSKRESIFTDTKKHEIGKIIRPVRIIPGYERWQWCGGGTIDSNEAIKQMKSA